MILFDLNQKIVDDVYGIFADVVGLVERRPPTEADIRTALAGEVKRYIVPAATGDELKAELWYAEDVNRNLIFTFAFPTELSKQQQEKAEATKATFDEKLGQFLVDYYL
ncbi:MAG: hypothetical protein AAB515_03810 [Patescibacteria group bacterium]